MENDFVVVIELILRYQAQYQDKLLALLKEIVIVPQIKPESEPKEVVQSEEYIPEAELEEWMNKNGMPMTAGWGPPGGQISEEQLPPTEYPAP